MTSPTPPSPSPAADPAIDPASAAPSPRQAQYYQLIDQLLACPNGQEPELLDNHPDLLDEGLVRSLIQVATYFSHENKMEAAQFLVHVARELAKQLGLYPEVSSPASES